MHTPESEQALEGSLPERAFTLVSMDEEQRHEYWSALALKHTPGLGSRSWQRLLTAFGSATQAVNNLEAWRDFGIRSEPARAFRADSWRSAALEEWRALHLHTHSILLWDNPYYPPLLKTTPNPPLFLYYQGDITLLGNPKVAVVGARTASPDGLNACTLVSRRLAAAGVTIVSGLARGIDKAAHMAALDGGPGSTIAVLGTGLDVIYPAEHVRLQRQIAAQGLVLTEYMPGERPEAKNFPVRNRIISGLSLGVLVVEAAARSGSLITARLALEYGREVFAVPGRFAATKAAGCQDLIRQGAKPVFDVEDILSELMPQLAEEALLYPAKSGATAPKTMPPDRLEGQILRALKDNGATQVDILCSGLKVPVPAVTSTLLILEVEGLVTRLPGMVYALKN
jgi:DNA processing protein